MKALQYKQIEAVLVRYYKIRDVDLKAFRARLRHLRNLGIPDIPKVGSGSRVEYSEVHLYELFLALEFVHTGIAPGHIKSFMEQYRKSLPKWIKARRQAPEKEFHLGFNFRFFGGEVGERLTTGTRFCSKKELWKRELSQLDGRNIRQMLVLNFNGCSEELDRILDSVTSGS